MISLHVFEGGCKRTGFVCASSFLEYNGYILSVDQDEAERICTGIAQSDISIEEVAAWLRKHSVPEEDIY